MTHEELRTMLVDAGLGRVADVIVREARSSILLTSSSVADEAMLALGAMKLGGSPDVPPDFAWPTYGESPLPFIAQINLSEITKYDTAHLLPQTGMLYFFYSYDHHRTFMLPESPEVWRVLYHDGDATGLYPTHIPSPLPAYHGPFRPCSLTPSAVVTLPTHGLLRAQPLGGEQFAPVASFTEAEIELYGEIRKRFAPPDWGRHRMLGYGDGVQYDMPLPGSMLLLQIDSDDEAGMMWGDVGTIYFMIRPDDLARCDFRNVKFDEQCC